MKTENEIRNEANNSNIDKNGFIFYEKIKDRLNKNASSSSSEQFNQKMEDLGVQEKENVIKWRSRFSIFMIAFLLIQYLVIISFLTLQGFSFKEFYLDNYIFYILIAGSLIQSHLSIRVIFQYLFLPNQIQRKKK